MDVVLSLMLYCMGWRGWMEGINRDPDGGIDGWQVKWVCMCACVCVWVCIYVWKGWNWITLGLGREHGSGCLIDRSHLESIGRSLTGQRRDKHNQHSLTHSKTNHGECNRRRWGMWVDVSMPWVLQWVVFGKVNLTLHSRAFAMLYSMLEQQLVSVPLLGFTKWIPLLHLT